MKNKENTLIHKTLFPFLLKITIWLLLFPLFFVLVPFLIRHSDFQWLYDFSPKIYEGAIHLFIFCFQHSSVKIYGLFFWLFGLIFLVYRTFKKIFSYVSAISSASQNLLKKEVDYIKLPPELEDLQAKLNHLKREAEKNEQKALESEQKKNDLIVYLAHDLKTPLTSMIGYLSLLDEIKDMPKKQREKYISVALNKSYRLEELINELFDIARFNSATIVLEKEEINLTLMLEQIIDDFYPILTENNKEIKLKYTKKILIEGDPDKLARVFGNLIKNAISYSKDRFIKMNVEASNQLVTITICNKGKKIPPEKLKKLFEKFYRVDEARTSKTGGSGLGLAIAKEIVELHGGTIEATSDEVYTKFIVHLPIKHIK